MTMQEIYEHTDEWVKELENEWLSEYGADLEEAWEEIDDEYNN